MPAATPIPQAVEKPPAAVTAGGQLINLMSYEECGCDPHQVIVASGGPERPPASWFDNPEFEPGDGRMIEILDRRGRDTGDKWACPITVTADGQVFGHIAPWDTCHIGMPGCVVAPHSKTDYAYFKRGQHVICADGTEVRVGTITADAPHASLDASGPAAMSHYDHTALCCADVNVGEDDFGIWVAGGSGRPRRQRRSRRCARARSAGTGGHWLAGRSSSRRSRCRCPGSRTRTSTVAGRR